ncbi:Beta-hexosaminidase 1 [Spatholobus suberectus]|nr:Beta-hexosaminidase 1 [Spatholobus suberectus]
MYLSASKANHSSKSSQSHGFGVHTDIKCSHIVPRCCAFVVSQALGVRTSPPHKSLPFIWPLPAKFSFGNETLSVDPALSLSGNGASSAIVRDAFDRYKGIVFKHGDRFSFLRTLRPVYDVTKLSITVHSLNEELQLGVDESYNLFVSGAQVHSGAGQVTIEASTVFGALRGLETFSQLCSFDYTTKTVQIYKVPWSIRDNLDFHTVGFCWNVLHWHIIDEQSFPLEVPTYPDLWKGSYTKWERYTVEDAYEIVKFLFSSFLFRGIGYPDLWPSPSCKEPLDVSKKFTFDVLSGILTDMRKIFPFELFHLGGDEVDTGQYACLSFCSLTYKLKLQNHNMTAKDAYQYFVLKAQNIALTKNWSPVNWEETFDTFPTKLHPQTVVHNWLGPGVCPKAVAKGFRCIFSNQGVWYLHHLDVPWDVVYTAEPLEGIQRASEQKLVLGGEVCMWGETADTSDVQQTIWPRAAAAAERLWSQRDSTSGNVNIIALSRLQYFRCLLNRRGVPAAPVTNLNARTAPVGPGSCFEQ